MIDKVFSPFDEEKTITALITGAETIARTLKAETLVIKDSMGKIRFWCICPIPELRKS